MARPIIFFCGFPLPDVALFIGQDSEEELAVAVRNVRLEIYARNGRQKKTPISYGPVRNVRQKPVFAGLMIFKKNLCVSFLMFTLKKTPKLSARLLVWSCILCM